MALVYIASLVVFASPPVEAQSSYNWVAYNDLAWAQGQPEANITKYTIPDRGDSSGVLVDYGTNTPVSAEVEISVTGSMAVTASGDRAGAEPASATDAYDTFHGIVDSTGVVAYMSGSWSVTLTFTGLDPARTYTFATTANRDGGYSDRYSRFTISDVESATNASTSGVTVISDKSVAFNTGENTAEGYVARWTGIQPGGDGQFTVTVVPHDGNSAYGPSVFMLAEEAGGDPPVQHSLTATDDGNGSVALSPPGGVYNAGTVVTLTPVADPGYQFSAWTGDNAADLEDNGNGTWSITMDADKSVHANFVESSGWVAYNDCAWASGQLEGNITTYTIPDDGTSSGLLVNYADGSSTNVTATLTASGAPGVQTGTYGGSETAADTDAHNTFHGIVSMPGVIQYGSEGWWVEVTFTGLDPDKTYTFATTANRGDSSYTDRITRFQILDVDAATNASSPGVTVASSESVLFNTGNNTENGYVARWTGIRPGDDGSFTVRAEAGTSERRAYAFSVFMLAEDGGDPPVQHTLSVTNDSNGSVALSPAGGVYNAGTVVTLTPVADTGYQFSAWTGDNAADLVNNGNGTWSITMDADKSVHANFVEATVPAWVAYNDLAWASPQPDTNITRFTIPAEGTASGALVDYATGDPLPASVAVSVIGSPGVQVSQGDYSGSEANPGTDAYQTFHGIADSTGVIYYGDTGWSVTLTFTGLDPAAEYTFATTANRDNNDEDYLDRVSCFTISDADAATNASTSGVTVLSNESIAFSTGYNTVNGYVARWAGIRPGVDGDFTVTVQADGRNEAYGPSVFMLAQGGGGPVNHAPDAPELVQPVDDATGVATAPTLEAAVSDPDGDTMDVTFYGREVGAGGEAGEPFTIIAIPDTQMATQSYPQNFTAQTQWIVDNAAAENIVFVTHLGDIVNTANQETQWQRADTSMAVLDSAGIPYSVGPGNHDLAIYSSPTYYPNYFGVDRFTGKPWYQGAYEAANNYDNYSLFSASGMDFILINLRYQPSTAVLNWADTLLESHSDRRAIVVSHSILNVNDSWTSEGSTIFNALKDNPNLFLMLCGHMHSGSDGAAQRADQGDDGHTIYSVLADYQDFSNGGNGYLLKLRFVPGEDSIDLETYSPTLDSSLSGEYDPATLVYDMEGTGAAPFVEIGTVSGVASGTSASLTWGGHLPNTEYEWYAVASDGSKSTQSATWSFTTAGVANTAPVLDPIGDKSVDELVELAFTASATDPEGDSFTFALAGAPEGASISADTGAFSWTPTEAQGPGGYEFSVVVCDDRASELCDQEQITVTVYEVNVAPVLAAIGDKAVDELTELTFTASAIDDDIPANILSFSLENAPSGASIDASTGAFSWTPSEAQGPDEFTFTVKVCDSGSPVLCDDEEITVTVNEVNQPPTADPQSLTTAQDTPLDITLTGSDPDGHGLNFAIVDEPENGTLSGTAPNLTYTPDTGYYGADSFTFKVSDGMADSPPATVSISVTPEGYALTVTTNGNGSVQADPDKTTYHYGDVVELAATADPGWTFSGWSGDVTSTDNPLTVTIEGDTAITATFTQETYALTVNVDGSGSVSREPEQDSYVYGDVVQLTATADSGWSFAGWSGDVLSTDNPLTVTIEGDVTVTATFTQDECTLTLKRVGSGVVSARPSQDTYRYGDEVQLTAVPKPGWSFSGWSGGLSGTDNPATLTIEGDTTVTAAFTQDAYTLTITTVGDGMVQVDPDLVAYQYDDEVELTAIAETGWAFSGWSGDITSTDNPLTVTIEGNVTVTATFTQIAPTCYALTLGHTGQGSDPVASPASSSGCQAGYYVAGEAISLSAAPAAGWQISGWTGTDDDSSPAPTNALTMPASDHEAGVTYTEIPPTCYALTLTHTGQGSDPVASPSNSAGCEAGYYVPGETISLSGAVPATNWRIDGWTGTSDDSSTSGANSLVMPANDHTAGVTYIEVPGAPDPPASGVSVYLPLVLRSQ